MRIKAREDFYHSTLTGAALRMNKGEIKNVSEELALQVISDGKAFPMEDDDADPAPAPEPTKEEEGPKVETKTEDNPGDEDDPTPYDHEVVSAMVTLAEEGDEDKLTQDGKPKAFAVKDFLGYSVDSEARENAWHHAQKQLPKE